jgi:hypothetical protein
VAAENRRKTSAHEIIIIIDRRTELHVLSSNFHVEEVPSTVLKKK